jgi:serine/threonine-protein kinase HipA
VTTSETSPREAFVWVWLPHATAPVVAGRIDREEGRYTFTYGRSYLERKEAIALYDCELPLKPGLHDAAPGLTMANCLRDAAPDAWGRRVILNRRFGTETKDIDVGQLDELTYMLESGSDRIGALDFQASATDYVPRESEPATLDELMEAADRVQKGLPLTPDLERALFHGTEIGGARPKALITGPERKYIAKFSSTTDVTDVVKAEYVAMRLARFAGLEVAEVRLETTAGRDVLLVERFDRKRTAAGWTRRAMVSALTLLELDEMMARYASYADLCTIVRHRFTAPKANLSELFGRMAFNILVGNTDDHARNHAAFWDGAELTLTPAYDICPQGRAGNEASQAMLITASDRRSQLQVCREAATQFLLTAEEADTKIEAMMVAIRKAWPTVCDEAELSRIDRNRMWGRQIFNPYSFEGLPKAMGSWRT